MIPGPVPYRRAQCKVRGPIETHAHTHECIGPVHGWDEHPCECGVWFKVAAVEVRAPRLPDSAREAESA